MARDTRSRPKNTSRPGRGKRPKMVEEMNERRHAFSLYLSLSLGCAQSRPCPGNSTRLLRGRPRLPLVFLSRPLRAHLAERRPVAEVGLRDDVGRARFEEESRPLSNCNPPRAPLRVLRRSTHSTATPGAGKRARPPAERGLDYRPVFVSPARNWSPHPRSPSLSLSLSHSVPLVPHFRRTNRRGEGAAM